MSLRTHNARRSYAHDHRDPRCHGHRGSRRSLRCAGEPVGRAGRSDEVRHGSPRDDDDPRRVLIAPGTVPVRHCAAIDAADVASRFNPHGATNRGLTATTWGLLPRHDPGTRSPSIIAAVATWWP